MENWKYIPGYDNKYMVSDLGNVKSLQHLNEKLLKFCVNSNGYLFVNLYKDGVSKSTKIHKLVAILFLGHKPNGTLNVVVDHINGIITDNRLDNLRLVSQRVNVLNRKKSNVRSSNFSGVTWRKRNKKWQSRIRINGKDINLGCFTSEIDAYNAYQLALNNLNK